jgi:hypothetical protein
MVDCSTGVVNLRRCLKKVKSMMISSQICQLLCFLFGLNLAVWWGTSNGFEKYDVPWKLLIGASQWMEAVATLESTNQLWHCSPFVDFEPRFFNGDLKRPKSCWLMAPWYQHYHNISQLCLMISQVLLMRSWHRHLFMSIWNHPPNLNDHQRWSLRKLLLGLSKSNVAFPFFILLVGMSIASITHFW